MLKNQKGFSLVELMIVVAIIGILAAIAIPNFQKFQEKAKQSEAKLSLAGVYTAEKALYAEYTTYDTGLDVIGFAPDGIAKYNVGFGAAYHTNVGQPVGGGTCDSSCSAAATGPATCTANFVTWTCAMNNGNYQANIAAATATVNTFVAEAVSNLNPNAATLFDSWTMSNGQVLSNTTSGL